MITDCPICKTKGSVLERTAGDKKVTTRCPMCWGTGNIPLLYVIREDGQILALHYWVCNCHQRIDNLIYQRVHPDNHDHCLRCDMRADQAQLGPAGHVQDFLHRFCKLDLEFIELT